MVHFKKMSKITVEHVHTHMHPSDITEQGFYQHDFINVIFKNQFCFLELKLYK